MKGAQIKFRKQNISIQSIGKQRFWIGTVVGFFLAILISLLFNHTREVFRCIIILSTDLLILEAKEIQFYNYFFSALATVLGFFMTMWIWMGNHKHRRRTDRIYKQQARTYSLLFLWVIMMLITRLVMILSFLLYTRKDYVDYLNLDEEYWLLFILLPLFLFIQNWSIVRRVYQAKKWILLSFGIGIITTFVLSKTTTVDQNKINDTYFKQYEEDYQYIEEEVAKAKSKYGVDFDVESIHTLKKWRTEQSEEQVNKVTSAFSKNQAVSMDTIILQKIIIRNCKKGKWSYRNPLNNYWPYALPNDVLKQIEYFDPNSNETKELLEVLKEQMNLAHTPKVDTKDWQNYTETQRRRMQIAASKMPEGLRPQLLRVEMYLSSDEKHKETIKELLELF